MQVAKHAPKINVRPMTDCHGTRKKIRENFAFITSEALGLSSTQIKSTMQIAKLRCSNQKLLSVNGTEFRTVN